MHVLCRERKYSFCFPKYQLHTCASVCIGIYKDRTHRDPRSHRIKTLHIFLTYRLRSSYFCFSCFTFPALLERCASTPKNTVSLSLGSWAYSGLKTQTAVNFQRKIQTTKPASCLMKLWKVNF